jgi:hypothetical protein
MLESCSSWLGFVGRQSLPESVALYWLCGRGEADKANIRERGTCFLLWSGIYRPFRPLTHAPLARASM